MELKIVKWGNSAAIRLPALLLNQIKVSIGATLSADVRPDGVLISPSRPKYALDDLIARCDPKAPLPADLAAWYDAKPVGREAW